MKIVSKADRLAASKEIEEPLSPGAKRLLRHFYSQLRRWVKGEEFAIPLNSIPGLSEAPSEADITQAQDFLRSKQGGSWKVRRDRNHRVDSTGYEDTLFIS